jgi:hypothetical protein
LGKLNSKTAVTYSPMNPCILINKLHGARMDTYCTMRWRSYGVGRVGRGPPPDLVEKCITPHASAWRMEHGSFRLGYRRRRDAVLPPRASSLVCRTEEHCWSAAASASNLLLPLLRWLGPRPTCLTPPSLFSALSAYHFSTTDLPRQRHLADHGSVVLHWQPLAGVARAAPPRKFQIYWLWLPHIPPPMSSLRKS